MGLLGLKIDIFSGLPNVYTWLIIVGFFITAIGGVTQFFVLNTQDLAIIGFVGFILTLLAQILTTETNTTKR
jgi:uncharacterized membrane protein